MAKDFQEEYPTWPPGQEKPLLQFVDVRVKLPVDKLFTFMYAAGSEFVVRYSSILPCIVSWYKRALQTWRPCTPIIFNTPWSSLCFAESFLTAGALGGKQTTQAWARCMQERSQEARGSKDYVESPWEGSAEELERFLALPPQEQAARERPTPELPQYQGRIRKTTCTGFGMGLKVRPNSEQWQRC